MMAEGSEEVELKFRIFDGTDICHGSYAPSTTVVAVKQSLFLSGLKVCGKSQLPKTVNDLKLIHLGKVLENNKTLSESRVRDDAFAGGGVITMHVVFQPVLTKKKSAKQNDGNLNSCGCTIQ